MMYFKYAIQINGILRNIPALFERRGKMMRNLPCFMAGIAALATLGAVISKLTGSILMGTPARGMLIFAMVMLLFGINHSLCKKCQEGKE